MLRASWEGKAEVGKFQIVVKFTLQTHLECEIDWMSFSDCQSFWLHFDQIIEMDFCAIPNGISLVFGPSNDLFHILIDKDEFMESPSPSKS